MENLYYSPELFGLETVMSEDIAGGYEFDICVLLKHSSTGRLFYGMDSGCSCPTPFEDDHFSMGENGCVSTTFTEVTKGNWEGAAEEMKQWLGDEPRRYFSEHFQRR